MPSLIELLKKYQPSDDDFMQQSLQDEMFPPQRWTGDGVDMSKVTPMPKKVGGGALWPVAIMDDGSRELDWGEGITGAAYDAFTAPKRAYDGEFDPLSDDGIGEAFNMAGMLMGGGFGRAAGSKATAELGSAGGNLKPVRAYHGMRGELEGGEFDTSRMEANFFSHPRPYFADDPAEASGYAMDRMATKMGSGGHHGGVDSGANVVPVDINYSNPFDGWVDKEYPSDIFDSVVGNKQRREMWKDNFETGGIDYTGQFNEGPFSGYSILNSAFAERMASGLNEREAWNGVYDSLEAAGFDAIEKNVSPDYAKSHKYKQITPVRKGSVRSAITGETLYSNKSPLAGAAVTAANHLPMDFESRMARAKAMGFDVDNPVYHGTQSDFEAFDPSKARTARYHFFTPEKETAAHYGDVVGEYFVRSGNQANLIEPGKRDMYGLRQAFDAIGDDYGYQTFDEFLDDVTNGQMYQKHANQYFQNDVLGELNASSGFDTVRMTDAGSGGAMSESTVVFDPSRIRSVNAAFDPDKIDSADLLARSSGDELAKLGGKYGRKPPSMDQRPFEADYPNMQNSDVLANTIDGAPLRAKYVAGRQTPEGHDVGLTTDQIADLSARLRGTIHDVPAKELPRGAGGSFQAIDNGGDGGDGISYKIKLLNSLTQEERDIVMAHEVGHQVDARKGGYAFAVDDFLPEAKKIYSDLWDGTSVTPEILKYPPKFVRKEYMAEALRAYMTDPNYIKTRAPGLAAYLRKAVNQHPEVSKVLQLNAGGFPLPFGDDDPWSE